MYKEAACGVEFGECLNGTGHDRVRRKRKTNGGLGQTQAQDDPLIHECIRTCLRMES